GMGVADAMPDTRLLERGGDGPDLAFGAGNLGGDGVQHGQSGRVDPVVIGDENAHSAPGYALASLLSEPGGGGKRAGAAVFSPGPSATILAPLDFAKDRGQKPRRLGHWIMQIA